MTEATETKEQKSALCQEAQDEAKLRELREKFDRRLEVLLAPGAGEKLRQVARQPIKLNGRVKAGRY